MSYDDSNVFARILRGEIPCDKVYEDDHVLAFKDIAPMAPVHILVIPKGAYVSSADFAAKASAEEKAAFMTALGHIAQEAGLDPDGYRLIANHGQNAHQEVPHFHMHIVGGRTLGRMLPKFDS